METFILFAIVAAAVAMLMRFGNKTDIPKVKGLPELPGVPFFGSLLLLGKHHARNCAKLVQQYGDVFQVRLGNRVSTSLRSLPWTRPLIRAENHLRQLFRLSQGSVDQEPDSSRIATEVLDFPRCGVRNPGRVHFGHFTLERLRQESKESCCNSPQSTVCTTISAIYRSRIDCQH